MEKPTVFVGSSGEGLELARAVQYQLRDDALVNVWNEGLFGLGQGTLESLVTMLDRFDFAVLVITPDDVVTQRDASSQAPRDNVMFELGLFMGRLGRARTFGVCSSARDLKLPSDLAGVTLARFNQTDAVSDVTAALGPACYQIRQAIRQLGLSDAKRLRGITAAASQVEGLSDQIANLVVLIARSRVLELDVIDKQFGSMLPPDFVAKLKQDLADLEQATTLKTYVDESVRYLGGHPDHDGIAEGSLALHDEALRFDAADLSRSFVMPRTTVECVNAETQHLGMERAEFEEGVAIGPDESLLRHTAVVTTRDPEGVYPDGFDIRFSFRNDYYAKLFAKKCSERFDVGPF